MTTEMTRPEDFGVMDCGDGITIRKAGDRYQVSRDGRFVAGFWSLGKAIKAVDGLKAQEDATR